MALVALPFLYGYFAKPAGSTFLGVPFAADDAMVYAAWMRQAMDGAVLFDNRFAIDPQPGLTFHAYFLVLGWLAKGVGIPIAMALARIGLSGLFVWLGYQLIRRVVEEPYAQKLSLAVLVFGGGLGFLMWHQFGVTGPVDVWQTEGFVFPSMLANGLFMASLCLIVGIFLCVLDARESWKPVPLGMVLFCLLMNVHSYDVLLVALVLVGFLVASMAAKRAAPAWVARVAVMALGVAPPALWFVKVLQSDTVFQARAATETYSPNFKLVVLGFVLLIALGLYGIWAGKEYFGELSQRGKGGVVWVAVLVGAMTAAAASHSQGYWMGIGLWAGSFASFAAAVWLLAGENDGRNLLISWGVLGLAIPYFPALFQRKLMMGLSVPWAILAGIGFAAILAGRERGVRNLVAIFGLAVLSGTSIQWFFRELSLIKTNVSNTTLHALYLTPNAREIMAKLAGLGPSRRVVLAMPGIALPGATEGAFQTPYLPDLNPVASGLTGAYSYAGHWSETPDYMKRRDEATLFFLRRSEAEQRAFLAEKGIDYLIAPVPEAFPEIVQMNDGRPFPDVRPLGEVIVEGPQFRLIKINSR